MLCQSLCMFAQPMAANLAYTWNVCMCRGRRCNVSPKLLLIPLSYASIFGGTTTLIGTSTNLVIAGLQSRRYAGTADATFNFFDITPYGLP